MTNATDNTPLPTPANPGPFGHKLRSQFLFPEDFTQFNHGSYGTFPKAVQDNYFAWHHRTERDPDRWMRRDLKNCLTMIRREIGEFINCDPDSLALVQNTTVGVNTILRSLEFLPGDRILQLSTGFLSVYKTAQYVCDTHKDVKLIEVPITFPMTDKEIVDAVEKTVLDHQALKDGSRIRLAMVDWISSVPSIVHPVKQLTDLLKSHGILVFVDGAHSIGQVPVDLGYLDPDFYITNCHKWLFSVRGSAALYTKKPYQNLIHPTAITGDYGNGFDAEFQWMGTNEYSSLMSIQGALAYRKQFGEDAIINYTHNLAIEGGKTMAKILGSSVLTPHDHQVGNMVNIRLPFKDLLNPKLASPAYLMNLLMDKYNLHTPTFKHGGNMYTRVCAQIYLELSDFVRLGNVWKEIVDEINAESN
ncbi:hypothetical protein BG006_001466 [Podila minutissima]|uniref:Aminotransferase class V domain-containing protein n=1 Tax=Podila minutissima TaxID=64525 RepID=A0A9P5VH77_9FUNG|nr:hypothetical protein BG006_001466 [Podila minutissima]